MTASRVVAAVVFASTALTPRYVPIAIVAYAYASLADLLDGAIARLLRRSSDGGGAFDIGGDKYLSIVSVLYAAAAGASLAACCLMIVRSVFVPALRTIRIDGVMLIEPRRYVGVIETLPLRFATLYMLANAFLGLPVDWAVAGTLYWITGVTSFASLLYSVLRDWPRLVRAFTPCDR